MARAKFGFLDVTLIPETRAIFESLSAEGEVLFLCGKDAGRLEQKLPEIDILFTRLRGIDREFLGRARSLKGIVMAGVGTDHIDVDAASQLNIPVVISPGNEVSTAESAVLLMLAVARQLALKNKNTTSSANLLESEFSPHTPSPLVSFGLLILAYWGILIRTEQTSFHQRSRDATITFICSLVNK